MKRRPIDNYTIRRRIARKAEKATIASEKRSERMAAKAQMQEFCIRLFQVLRRLRPVAQFHANPKSWKHAEDIELVQLYASTGDAEATALAISRKVTRAGVSRRLAQLRRMYE